MAPSALPTPETRPLKFILKNIDRYIYVRLKDNTILYGRLVACDTNMNIVLLDAEEKNSKEETLIKYGKVFIRGNNIVYFRFPELSA